MEQVVAQLRTNLCNMTVLSDTDLEALANMDPDSVSDLGHREFVTHIKEIAGRSGGVFLPDGEQPDDDVGRLWFGWNNSSRLCMRLICCLFVALSRLVDCLVSSIISCIYKKTYIYIMHGLILCMFSEKPQKSCPSLCLKISLDNRVLQTVKRLANVVDNACGMFLRITFVLGTPKANAFAMFMRAQIAARKRNGRQSH